ncbi:hypothetical protein [Paraburkholderia sp. GAS82]|uniref:hypothetical protein n=1 Tax=Paraburkholderia sp. GAS82 TaxID=3035137 RepID=UPI003D19038E
MNGPDQPYSERDFAPENTGVRGDHLQIKMLIEAIDLVLLKAMQLQGLLALMAHSAVDDEVIPAHRLAVCQIASDLSQDVIAAVTAAIGTH